MYFISHLLGTPNYYCTLCLFDTSLRKPPSGEKITVKVGNKEKRLLEFTLNKLRILQEANEIMMSIGLCMSCDMVIILNHYLCFSFKG